MRNLALLCSLCALGLAAAESNALEDLDPAGDRGGRAGAGAGPAVLAEIARALISRSATSSQVLSLNLTNLVILLVLKAIIFGAGSMGLGWAGKGARAGEPDGAGAPLVSEQEALLLLGFLMGGRDRDRDQSDSYQCLNRVACLEPDAANSYARAGALLSTGAKMLSGMVPFDDKYEGIVSGMFGAMDFGRSGGRCDARYSCSR